MVRSAKGTERLLNLICISYAACKLLPYYDKEFADYRGQSTQDVRYQLSEKIRMGIIIQVVIINHKTAVNHFISVSSLT